MLVFSLHVPCSLRMCDSSLLSCLFLLFSFCFPLCFFWGGGCSSFYINHFNGPVLKANCPKTHVQGCVAPNPKKNAYKREKQQKEGGVKRTT